MQRDRKRTETDGERERKKGRALDSLWLVTEAQYLGGILVRGEEAFLSLVQLLQHLVPRILRHVQLLFQLHNVILYLGAGGPARQEGDNAQTRPSAAPVPSRPGARSPAPPPGTAAQGHPRAVASRRGLPGPR